jgi:tetratricopeptide (TPR) repeat protein
LQDVFDTDAVTPTKTRVRRSLFSMLRPPDVRSGKRERTLHCFISGSEVHLKGFFSVLILPYIFALPLLSQDPPAREIHKQSGENAEIAQRLEPPTSQSNRLLELELLVRENKLREAENIAQSLLARSPEDPLLLYWAGYLQFQQKNYSSAIPLLRAAEKRKSDLPNLAKYLSVCYYALNQYVLFEKEVQEALRLSPKDPELHYFLGLYKYSVRDELASALNSFNRALELRPLDQQALYHRGRTYEILGDNQKAREDYLKSIELIEKGGQSFSLPYQGIASLLLENFPGEALQFAQKSIGIEPGSESGYFLLGKIYSQLGKLPEAIAAFQRLATLNPTSGKPHYWLYSLYLRTGDRHAAEAALSEFQRCNEFYGKR